MHVFKIFQLKPSTYHQIVALGSKDSMLRICFFSAPTGVPYRARLHHAAHCQWDRPKSRAKHGLWTRTAPLLRCQVWWITACLKMGFTQWDSYNILKDLVGSGAPHSQTHLVDCIAIPVWWSHGRPVGSSHGTSLLQETPVVLWFYLQWSRWAFCGVLVGTRCVNVWKPETADFCHRLNFWRILGYWGCVDLVAWIIYYYIYTHIYYIYLSTIIIFSFWNIFFFFFFFLWCEHPGIGEEIAGGRGWLRGSAAETHRRPDLRARRGDHGAPATFSGKMMISCR